MLFNVITIFPEMFAAMREQGVVARALKKKLITLNLHQLRDYSDDKHGRVDDKGYGGGAGMVMAVAPIRRCLRHVNKTKKIPTVYLSPQGKPLTQQRVLELSQMKALNLLCGRYQGVDERIIKRDVDWEISVGDFVCSGGELPAMLLIDAIARQLPGVLGNEDSLLDSFTQDGLLDYPHYTRPEVIDKQCVPKVLLSGHDKNIATWRRQQALANTKKKRPDLLKI